MAKRRGNPNWGKPEPIGPVVPTVTSFEQVVKSSSSPLTNTSVPLGFVNGPAGTATRSTSPKRCWKPGVSRSSRLC